ncbi:MULTISPECIES: squalene/phytoene synthase family protein [Bacillaceae]|uniref:Phytoene/squalene synthase family protein n=1 Tax=Evansella alkalicola TaxID=745819 RepID=A0ABS6JSK4_9BACI|nr:MULTISPECIES: phytoene/squalene synthase family protein [Bacillaceae]MBU9720150.1 phytoene/squalene synthase family protein [Bacillus alkalicola]
MSNDKQLQKEAMQMLKLTSRTFYIPITLLEPTLKKTVASAYLCMRAIDEIEDHVTLDSGVKEHLLRETASLLKKPFDHEAYLQLVSPYSHILPEVTLKLGNWISTCPSDIVHKVQESTSIMANGMAEWVRKNWHIKTKEDLNDYTYYVAGLVGVMLSDIWEWRDGTKTDRDLAIAYGRGLQTVNILRNVQEDKDRGVNFIPAGWSIDDTFDYAERNLALGDEYMKDINSKTILLFCKIPLALAKKTLQTLKSGKEKMSRSEVEAVVEEITGS